MTRTELPRRPYPEMTPSPDGLLQVRAEAGRRRRRRMVVVSAGGAGIASAVAAVVVLAAGGGGVAVLRPEPAGPVLAPTPSVTTPLPSSLDEPGGSRQRARHAPATAPRVGTQQEGASVHAGPSSPAPTRPTPTAAAPPGAAPAPVLSRRASSYDGAPRVCGGSSYSDTGGTVENGVGWCLLASAQRTSAGERLTVNLCRDSTAGGTLTFGSSREVDLALSVDGRSVWSWSKTDPGHPDAHRLPTSADGCWDWTLTWPGTTQAGSAAPHGTYTLTATSTADELKGRTDVTTFTY
jgi:hypothetical protein